MDSLAFALCHLVPENTSRFVRYTIECLFSIHGETKLNMICPIGIDAEVHYGRVFRSDWCAILYQHLRSDRATTTMAP